MKQDQIREMFCRLAPNLKHEIAAEHLAQIAESNEYLKRIADALEQLVHRGVPE